MSIDGEMWTREAGDLRDVLPRAAEWDYYEDGHAEIEVGDNDLVIVGAPEEDTDLPPDIASIASGQRFRVSYTIEPISAAPQTLEFSIEVVEAVTRAWDGVAFHPRTGHPIVWES